MDDARPGAKGPALSWQGPGRGLVGALLLLALIVSRPMAGEAGPSQATVERGALPRFSVDVGAVALDVLVTDGKGRFVRGLKPTDFRVRERGVLQELTFFTASRTPVTIVLLLDSSASVRSNLLSVQRAASRFTEKLERDDRALVGFFHERVVFGPRFTGDHREHSAMVNQMRPQRSTHLYDALVQAFDRLEPIPRRKALLVFSDGDDQGSRASVEDALDAARRSDASVYAVGLVGWSADDGMHTNQGLLEELARVTGGRALFPEDEKKMLRAFDRIRDELHHQYRMGYVPPGVREGEEGWREISVEVPGRRGLLVRSRLGYYSERSGEP